MAGKIRRAAPEAISIQVAAAVLCVSEDTIRRRIRSGELEAVKFGKLWRIPKDVLARLRRQRERGEALFPEPVTITMPERFAHDVARLVAIMLIEDARRRREPGEPHSVPMHT